MGIFKKKKKWLPEVVEKYQEGMNYYNRKSFKKALKALEEAGNAGHPDAQYMAGMLHKDGKGTPANKTKAFVWMEKAAMQEHTDAMSVYARMLYYGEGTARNAAEGMRWMRKVVNQGHSWAKRELTEWEMHEAVAAGQRKKENTDRMKKKRAKEQEKAARLYREALEMLEKYEDGYKRGDVFRKLKKASELDPGNGDIVYRMGQNYMRKAEDSSSALPYAGAYLKKAMDLGSPEAALDYFKSGCWERKGSNWRDVLAKGAELGVPELQYLYGYYLFTDGKAWAAHPAAHKLDVARGDSYFHKQRPYYQSYLGRNRIRNDSNEISKYEDLRQKYRERGFRWIQKAAAQGYVSAMAYLGSLYFEGEYVEQDYEKAVSLMERAAEHYDCRGIKFPEFAMVEAGYPPLELADLPMDYDKAIQEHEEFDIRSKLAFCYEKGLGVEADPKKAEELWARAEEDREILDRRVVIWMQTAARNKVFEERLREKLQLERDMRMYQQEQKERMEARRRLRDEYEQKRAALDRKERALNAALDGSAYTNAESYAAGNLGEVEYAQREALRYDKEEAYRREYEEKLADLDERD